jgi:hypothetical protein
VSLRVTKLATLREIVEAIEKEEKMELSCLTISSDIIKKNIKENICEKASHAKCEKRVFYY